MLPTDPGGRVSCRVGQVGAKVEFGVDLAFALATPS